MVCEVGLGGILALSLLLVAVAPNLAVAFHGILWLLFGYFLGAHISLRARVRQIMGRVRRRQPGQVGDVVGGVGVQAGRTQGREEPEKATGRSSEPPSTRSRAAALRRGKGPTVH